MMFKRLTGTGLGDSHRLTIFYQAIKMRAFVATFMLVADENYF